MPFNWQRKDWPNFKYDLSVVEEELYAFAESLGRVSGMLNALPEEVQAQAMIDTMLAEAVKTSEIESI